MMAISRSKLLKELLPGLNELFGAVYENQAEDRHARNKQAHGLDRYIESVIGRSHKIAPKSYKKAGAL